MTFLAGDLRTFVLADAAIQQQIGDRMEKDKSSKRNLGRDRIVYFRDSVEQQEPSLEDLGTNVETYTLECISRFVANSEQLAANVRTRLDGHIGAFGDASLNWAFVDDADDSYVARGIESDQGSHAVALTVQLNQFNPPS